MRIITPSSRMMYTNVISLNEISILTPALKSSPSNKTKGGVGGIGLSRSCFPPQPNPGRSYNLRGKPCMSVVIYLRQATATAVH